ncbi:hypothetical protein ATI61_104436 [Archangium gephyra]|uniref:Uncharacterized protein n=1 Tax=Archangium gephyra TaxID=48 RepID=A0ABX9K4P2_9BACT|nr:hypothetical protein [Archangium gephyra]REG33146.1 hypothetical protein ATI61_104436 [Archangium gephyra]
MSDEKAPEQPAELPSLERFLTAPLEEVRQVVPATLVWVVEGTRRSAALAGIDVRTEDYARWSMARMNECVGMFFHHGVRHVFTPLLTPSQFAEVPPRYRERLFDWVAMLVRERELLAPYLQNGWRLRLLGAESLPELRPLAEEFAAATPRGEHTLWCSIVAESGAPWNELLQAVVRTGSRTREDAIRALYGEDIPLASLMVAFGKPLVSPEQVPPLLAGKMDCYFTQRPGYRITEREFRTILHDHAYVRRTWRPDKTGRAEEATEFRRAWEEGPLLGLGIRLGPFWYPAPLALPLEELPE